MSHMPDPCQQQNAPPQGRITCLPDGPLTSRRRKDGQLFRRPMTLQQQAADHRTQFFAAPFHAKGKAKLADIDGCRGIAATGIPVDQTAERQAAAVCRMRHEEQVSGPDIAMAKAQRNFAPDKDVAQLGLQPRQGDRPIATALSQGVDRPVDPVACPTLVKVAEGCGAAVHVGQCGSNRRQRCVPPFAGFPHLAPFDARNRRFCRAVPAAPAFLKQQARQKVDVDALPWICLLYTFDAADDLMRVELV